MKAVIIDDEINNSSYLKNMIGEQIPFVEICGIASGVNEGIKLIAETKPNIVFLDIELQTATGFDLLGKIPQIDFSVVFTTAHEHYALKAIRFAALDFLLKPVDPEELSAAVNKAVKQQKDKSFNRNMEVFLENMRGQNEPKRIAISTLEGLNVIDLKEIIYCQADGPYTNIHLSHGKVVSSKNLKEYETLISEYHFFRVHKSFLVNISEIKKYVRADGGYVVMSNGDKVNVSEKKRDELMGKLSSSVIFM